MMFQVDISAIGITSFSGPEGQFDVDVFDSATDYVKLMKYAISSKLNLKSLISPPLSLIFIL